MSGFLSRIVNEDEGWLSGDPVAAPECSVFVYSMVERRHIERVDEVIDRSEVIATGDANEVHVVTEN